MTPRIVTPGTTPVSRDDAKTFCDVQHDEDNGDIDSFLATALAWLQPPFGILRLSIARQTLRLDLPCWPGPIELPAGPVDSITSVKYFDTTNVEQTIDGSSYFLDNDTLMWADTFAAPAVYTRPSAVRITYLTGFEILPDVVKTAILMCVKHWYDNRDAVMAVGALNMMPLGVDDLLHSYRFR